MSSSDNVSDNIDNNAAASEFVAAISMAIDDQNRNTARLLNRSIIDHCFNIEYIVDRSMGIILDSTCSNFMARLIIAITAFNVLYITRDVDDL